MVQAVEQRDSEVPTLGTSIFLATFLLVPFVSHMLATEPFPAIILPAGENVFDRSQDTVTIRQWVIQGRREGRQEFEDIAAKDFFSPMPSHYLHAIMRNQFGLEYQLQRHIRGRKGLIEYEHAPIGLRQASNVDEAKQWYTRRLSHLGFDSTVFRFAIYELSCQDGQVASDRKLVEHVKYELH